MRSGNNTPGGLVAARQRNRRKNLVTSMTMLAHVHANETDKREYGQKDRNQAKNSERLPSPAGPGAVRGAGHVAGNARSDEERILYRSHKHSENNRFLLLAPTTDLQATQAAKGCQRMLKFFVSARCRRATFRPDHHSSQLTPASEDGIGFQSCRSAHI